MHALLQYTAICHDLCDNYFVADSVPSTKQLLPFVADIAPSWYEVGAVLLDVKQESQLRLIRATHTNDLRKCCLAMLQYWTSMHREATWHQLVSALRSPGVDLATLASEIEKNFSGNNDVITVCISNVYHENFSYHISWLLIFTI